MSTYDYFITPIQALSVGDVDKARKFIESCCPIAYGNALISKDGQFTEVGIEWALERALSPSFKSTLKTALVNDNCVSFSEEGFGVLCVMQLIESSGALTALGKSVAISALPLQKQCEVLGLSFQEITVPVAGGSVESAVLNEIVSDSDVGVHDEGLGIRTAIKGVVFESLMSFKKDTDYSVSYGVVLESMLSDWPRTASLSVQRFQIADMAMSKLKVSKFEELFEGRVIDDYLRKKCQDLTVEVVCRIGAALGEERLRKLLRVIASKPYVYSSGWPDLTIITDEGVQLVEVKQKDKLRISQVRLVPLLKECGLDVKIVKATMLRS